MCRPPAVFTAEAWAGVLRNPANDALVIGAVVAKGGQHSPKNARDAET